MSDVRGQNRRALFSETCLRPGPNSWRSVPFTAAQTRLSDLGIAADGDAASRIQEELATEIAGYSKIKVGAVERKLDAGQQRSNFY